MSAELRREWKCTGERCGVRIYVPGKKTPPPNGWDPENELCLRCVREAEGPEARARRLLLEGKTAKGVNGMVAELNLARVRDIQQQLADEGHDIDPPDRTKQELNRAKRGDSDSRPKRPRRAKRLGDYAQAEDELRGDPSRSNKEIAKASGMNANSVSKLRRRLALPSPQEVRRT